MPENPNIAVVVLDTLRKDYFDDHFDWLPGRRFENAWAPSHWTVPVHGSLFTGKYASEVGVHAKAPAFDYPGATLPELLSDAGYTTRAFSSNVNISKQSGFARGFDEFAGNWRVSSLGSDVFDWAAFANETPRQGPSKYAAAVWACVRSDADTLRSLKRGATIKLRDLDLDGSLVDDGASETLEWLRETTFGDRELLFVNLMEAHSPYLPPRGYRTVERVAVDGLRGYLEGPDVDPATARRAYGDSVRYLADRYREMYDRLSSSFDYVITLSDHGELLGEHGAWDHVYGLYPELTHVPLVVDGPDMSGESERTVSLLDVHATVAELAGIDAESRGRSLVDDPQSASWLTEYHGLTQLQRDSLTDDGYDPAPLDTELRGVAGPDGYYGYETGDGVVERGDPDGAGSFRDRVRDLEDDLDRRSIEHRAHDEELQSQLEALGYG